MSLPHVRGPAIGVVISAEKTSEIGWGILGPGKISRAFAEGLLEAEGAVIAAVGSRDPGRAADFATEFGAGRAHGSYEELAADPAVDAVYIGTPHAFHHAQTLMCLLAGKHVLCEKALALNAGQAAEMITAARESGLVLMEAMWTRFLPAMVRVRELLAAGAIGEVRSVTADFGFRAAFDPASRLFAPELGGGALLDIGVYPLNLAYMVCGEPLAVHSLANLGATGVDEESVTILHHSAGRLSNLSCSFRADTPREARIQGTEGAIAIGRPWWKTERIILQPRGGEPETIDLPARGGGYTHEAEAFMDLIRSGERESEIMPLDESLAIMMTMDEVRSRWGMKYPGE